MKDVQSPKALEGDLAPRSLNDWCVLYLNAGDPRVFAGAVQNHVQPAEAGAAQVGGWGGWGGWAAGEVGMVDHPTCRGASFEEQALRNKL